MSVGEYLLDGTLGLEEDASAKQLGKDAAHRPDVDGVGIVPAPHQDLWRSVVLRHHLLGHVTRLVQLLHSRQAKVTNLYKYYHYLVDEWSLRCACVALFLINQAIKTELAGEAHSRFNQGDKH